MEMLMLGSAGWMPQVDRMTTSVAVRAGRVLFLLDAGTGVSRLKQPRYRRMLPEEGPIHIFLSHLHLDHLAGLTFLPALWHKNPTFVHVPDESVSGYEPDVLHTLVGPPFFPHGFNQFPMPVSLEALSPGNWEVEGLTVRVKAQRHPGGSLGFRVDDALAFLTDTVYDESSIDFVRGTRTLVHEAWIQGAADPEDLKAGLAAHTSAEDAARIAQEAGVDELLLAHLSPLVDESYYASMLAHARAIFPNTNLAEDGLSRVL